MKRLATVFVCLLLVSLIVVPAFSQVVDVKRDARSDHTRDLTTPDTTWQVYTGLRTVGVGSTVYFKADTTGSGANVVSSFTWTLTTKPGGSSAALSSTNTQTTKFIADVGGQYIIQVAVNGGATDRDTIWASTYVGIGSSIPSCGALTGTTCHNDKLANYNQTGHGLIFAQGMTGQLSVNTATYGSTFGKGEYSVAVCAKCHTTSGDPALNNGNFGYLAHQTGWDTTWYKPYTFKAPFYWIPYQDSTAYKQLMTTPAYSSLVGLSKIGCESCHGPGANHSGDKTKISKTYDAGVCQTCHDAPPHHTKGTEWATSDHALMSKGHAASTSCYPCHSGSAFVKWVDNGKVSSTTPWSLAADGMFPIACASCHDPHSVANPHQLRTMDVDSLNNGYMLPPSAQVGGMGQLCMNCHRSRYNVTAKVIPTKAPLYGFVNNYGPHGNPQTDMLFGRNGWQYMDSSFTGVATHLGVKDACVTCHMTGGNHTWAMVDTTGGLHDVVDACKDCHTSSMTTFDDIKASFDYDHNGKIEGVQTEVQGLLTKLKAKIAAAGGISATTGEPTLALSTSQDTLVVKNKPVLVQDIYTYTFVKNDGSMGVHNTKYAVSMLQKALGYYPTYVNKVNQQIPATYELGQNYPNPFNPSTAISFSLPKQDHVVLTVYDMLGKEINRLVDGEMSAGSFKVTWNGDTKSGEKVTTGVYFYRLQAGTFSSVKKMVMLK
jgi:hypothetical protein